MKIINFIHDDVNETIKFDVEHNGETNTVEINKTDRGTSHTDIDDFTEEWSESEYHQIEEFVDGCSEILHQFWH